jgi:WD40 repeat protein
MLSRFASLDGHVIMLTRWLFGSLFFVLAVASQAQQVDRLGDPLPPTVIARLGTARLRETDTVAALAFSPDGKLLASTAYNSSAVHLWDAATGKEVRAIAGDYGLALSFASDGKSLAIGDAFGKIRLYNLAENAITRQFQLPARPGRKGRGLEDSKAQDHAGIVRLVAFSADGKQLVAASELNTVITWEIASGKELSRAEGPLEGREAIAFSSDGKHAAFRDVKGRIALRTARAKEKLRPLAGKQLPYTPAAFSPDGKTVVAAGSELLLFLSSTDTTRVIRELEGVPLALRSLAFSDDGKILAAGGMDTVVLWNPSTGKELRRWEGLSTGSAALAFSPDGKILAIGGWDGAIRLRRVATSEDACPLPGHQGGIQRVVFSADGKFLVSAAEDRTVRFWSPASGKKQRAVTTPAESTGVVAFSQDCKMLASWCQDGSIRLWDSSSGKVLHKLSGPDQPASPGAAFSPDGKQVAVWDHDPVLRVHDTASGKELRRYGAPRQMVAASFSPDGETLVTSDRGHTIRLWRTASAREFRHTQGLTSEIWGVLFSPDGRTVLSRGNDTLLQLWEVATGKERWRTRINTDAAVFSPDGKLIATAIGTNLFLFDAFTGKKLHEWQGHRRMIRSLAFSPDGRMLASGSWDTSILVWDLAALRRSFPPSVKKELSAADLERLTTDLAGSDATQANLAIDSMAGAPELALPHLRKHLHPVTEQQGVRRLIADLDSPRFAVRSKALAKLQRLGETAEPALRKALAEGPKLEVRRRIEGLLEEIDSMSPSAESLRAFRAIEILERIGGPDPRKIIETLTRGVPEARLTQDAKATLRRIRHGEK